MRSFASFSAIVTLGSVLSAAAAQPCFADEAAACPFPASDAKELATRGLLRAARAKLTSCASACEGEERALCSAALDALHVPTIVVTVADASPEGAPRNDVRVVVDGEDAKPNVPIEVDPGPHLVQVQGPRIGAERHVVVAAGADKLAVGFATPKNVIEREAEQGGASGWPFVLIGVGFAGIGVGMMLAIAAQIARVRDPEGDPYDYGRELVPNPTLRTAGVSSVVGGIALVAGGITWHFLDKPAPRAPRTGFTPWLVPLSGGASFGLDYTRAF